MFKKFRAKTHKTEESIISLNTYVATEFWKRADKKYKKISPIEKEIKRLENKIKEIRQLDEGDEETQFKPVAKRIAYFLALLTDTDPIFVFNPMGGAGFRFERQGVAKYHIYLQSNCGVGLHTWRYTSLDETIREYNRIERVFVKINNCNLHNFSDYPSDDMIRTHIDRYCKCYC